MYRQYDQEQSENNGRETQDNADMYGQIPYYGTQQFQSQPTLGQGMQEMYTQTSGRPMMCPMMYENQLGQYESQEYPDMYRQHGMHYYHGSRPGYHRPRPYYYRPRPYFNIYPFFFPYYYPNYSYSPYYEDEYDYEY